MFVLYWVTFFIFQTHSSGCQIIYSFIGIPLYYYLPSSPAVLYIIVSSVIHLMLISFLLHFPHLHIAYPFHIHTPPTLHSSSPFNPVIKRFMDFVVANVRRFYIVEWGPPLRIQEVNPFTTMTVLMCPKPPHFVGSLGAISKYFQCCTYLVYPYETHLEVEGID